MKFTTNLIASLLCTIALIGCQTDNTTTDFGSEGVEGTTYLSISLENSRTTLGDKVGDTYPVFWSEGDRIVVNGYASKEVTIDADNKSRATFEVAKALDTPFHITYPYNASLSGSSKVLFLAEQAYTEGTFAPESAPMCGYVANLGDKIALKHLSSVLRFPVKAAYDGVILDRVVITSTEDLKLAGEFDVDCATATISASANATNSITYTLPEEFALSTSSEQVLYISVPATDAGICKVEFVDKSGEKMTRYWDSKDATKGNVRNFKSIIYQPGVGGKLESMTSESDNFAIYYRNIYGYVKDNSGKPISGVAVSDGFQVVSTNEQGYYSISNVTPDTWYIYITVPAEYEIPINGYGQPCFYKPYPSDSAQYDFTLTPLAGGKEKKFALFTIGDPQVRNTTQFNRFNTEAVPGILKHSNDVKATGLPCYAITLGDIIANSDGTNTESLRDDMRDAFHVEKAGLPVFQTYGNHDNTYYGDGVIIEADERSSTFELKAQRNHEAIFGPVDYSFDRGDVHIVSMRNIVYQHADKSGKYAEGFLKHQYEWLEQDLALVPKDKLVILCVHAPIFRNTGNYVEQVEDLLCEFNEAHIVSGHTHYSRNFEYSVEEADGTHTKLYDHNVGALCGVWWRGNIACDGAPTGYNVFVCDGNKFVESYFMGVNEGMNTKEKQMRLHRGNAITGRERKSSDTYAKTGYFAFNFGEDYLVANIYNADSKWVIKVYEDGIHTGNMEKVAISMPSSSIIGDYSYENPRRAADGVNISLDWYTAAFYYNYYEGRSAWSECYHLYKYQLKNKDAQIRVEATDGYGNVFTETEITEGTDYSLIAR